MKNRFKFFKTLFICLSIEKLVIIEIIHILNLIAKF